MAGVQGVAPDPRHAISVTGISQALSPPGEHNELSLDFGCTLSARMFVITLRASDKFVR